jgi:hypothetical protein
VSDPYEPTATSSLGAEPPIEAGLGWTIPEALAGGWQGYATAPIVLLLSYLLLLVIGLIPMMVALVITVWGLHVSPLSPDFAPTWQLVSIPCTMPMLFLGPYLEGGLTRQGLSAVRETEVTFGQLFSAADVWPRLLGLRLIWATPILLLQFVQTALLYTHRPAWPVTLLLYAVMLGLVLWMALGAVFASVYVVDRGLGPIEALGTSWRATAGQRGKVLLFCLCCFLLMMVAECTCFLPVLVAMPVIYVAGAYVYTRLPAVA